MSSISPHLRLFCSPKLLPSLRSHAKKPPFLFPRSLSLLFSSPITFQRLSTPHSIKSQNFQHQEEQSQQATSSVDPALLPRALQDIIALFQSVSDPKAKYQQLLHYGARLPPLDPRHKTDGHRVRGCVSQVWVRVFPDPADPAAVLFEADSDSALTKGLAAILVLGLSGASAPAIARVRPEFVHLLGLRQSLTPSRNNGFLNMLRLMQHRALQVHGQGGDHAAGGVLDEKNSIVDDGSGKDSAVDGVLDAKDLILDENSGGSSVAMEILDGEDVNLGLNGDALSSSGGGSGGRAARIRERLERELRPVELELDDVSYQHAGHAGVIGNSSGETHFNVRIVSKEFEGKSLVKRHRLVYDLLQEELQSGLHALSIVAKTPSEVGMR